MFSLISSSTQWRPCLREKVVWCSEQVLTPVRNTPVSLCSRNSELNDCVPKVRYKKLILWLIILSCSHGWRLGAEFRGTEKISRTNFRMTFSRYEFPIF